VTAVVIEQANPPERGQRSSAPQRIEPKGVARPERLTKQTPGRARRIAVGDARPIDHDAPAAVELSRREARAQEAVGQEPDAPRPAAWQELSAQPEVAAIGEAVQHPARRLHLGRELGLPDAFVNRHPFPGPGLAIRIPGEVSEEKLAILRKADAIYLDEIRKRGLYDKIWQAFAVLLPVRTVGVMGDARTYDFVCALRAVTSIDGMTADYYDFSHEFLGAAARRIINEVRGINRVVYDITSKPPGTIEWE
jgi:hypothetical protein